MRPRYRKRQLQLIAKWLPVPGFSPPWMRSFLMGGACGLIFSTSCIYYFQPEHASTQVASRAPQAPIIEPHTSNFAETKKITSDTPPMNVLPASVSLRVGSGDTLIDILTDTGVSYEEAAEAVLALRKVFDPRKLDVGSQVAVNLDKSAKDPHEPIIKSLSVPLSRTSTVELKRTQEGEFHAKKVEMPVTKKLVAAGGMITSSFYQTGVNAGIPVDKLYDLIKLYSYDVDFQREVKRGNRIDVLMERLQTDSGVVAGYGNVVYASLVLDNRKLTVYRHTDKNGNTDYYTEKGESLRKALLRTPINGARITSRYGMRMHPVLGYSRMHRGIDFGAPAGTPIYAAGDGVVTKAGWNGSYGNFVQLRHDKKYSTAYAHASRIASGVRPGARVKQGQVIAYVGTTGRSTGAHLHYEILAGNEQVNPAGVKFKTGNALGGKELASFKRSVEQVKLALGGKTPDAKQLASAE